jgi:hypothetical protein
VRSLDPFLSVSLIQRWIVTMRPSRKVGGETESHNFCMNLAASDTGQLGMLDTLDGKQAGDEEGCEFELCRIPCALRESAKRHVFI